MCTGPVSFETKSVKRAWAETSCGIVSRSKKIAPRRKRLSHLRHHVPFLRPGEDDHAHPVIADEVIGKLDKILHRPDPAGVAGSRK